MFYINSLSYQFSSVAQSCLTLCNLMDCSTPGFPSSHQLPELAQTHVHWVSDAIETSHPLLSHSPPAFNLSLYSWGNCIFGGVCMLSCVRLFAIPWTAARQAPLFMGFSRQEYPSGLPFPSPGDLPDPEFEPGSPALPGRFFTVEPPGKPSFRGYKCVTVDLEVNNLRTC